MKRRGAGSRNPEHARWPEAINLRRRADPELGMNSPLAARKRSPLWTSGEGPYAGAANHASGALFAQTSSGDLSIRK